MLVANHRSLVVAATALALGPLNAAAADAEPTPTITKAPIFLPSWDDASWSLVRGSILSENATASETTYTIFCPIETPPACDLSLEFPFIVVEGPHTVRFEGTLTSTYIADLGCDLDGTTEATCSGYSSYKSGYSNGLYTGPTEVSWTSTFTGDEFQFGALTLADMPTSTDDALKNTATAALVPTTELVILPTTEAPSDPEEGVGSSPRVNKGLVVAASLSSALLASRLLI